MNRRLLLLRSAVLALSLSSISMGVMAQGCTNATQYPGGVIVPDPLGAVTTLSTCNFLEEFSAIGPVIAGATYNFTCTGGAYITVHEGSSGGPVIANGYSPLQATATVAGNLYAHWNADSLCAVSSVSCETTTVNLMLNCTPPTVTVVPVDDCANNQFSLIVNITSLGDGTDVDLIYTVSAGPADTISGLVVGVDTLGPFTVGQIINLTVTHSSDYLCNVNFTGLMSNNTCPTIIQCGGAPLDQTYCYINNDNNHWLWQSAGGEALIAIFSAGTLESNQFDHIRFYDGIPGLPGVNLIWENTLPYPGTDLAGFQVISPTGSLYMENSSDGSVSCQSGGQTEWVWQVGCLDCQPAIATYNVVTDCDNYQFSVEVHITTLGSDATLDISADSLGTVLATATDTGVYTVGPFTANVPVNITMQNTDNSLCNVVSPALVNPLCPQIITCGDPAVELMYCYGLSDVHAWHWQAASPNDSLSLVFLAGSIEGAFSPGGDHLTIYDGPDNTSPILFSNGTATTNLAGLQVTGTGTDLYMEMTSDTYGSCSSGTTIEWDWIVGCADCSHSVATYTVVPDCDNYQFSVDVNITTLGSDATLDILEGGTVMATATATGTVTVGPFTANTPVLLTLENSENSLCNTYSPSLVNSLCPTPVACGVDTIHDSYCYIPNDSHTWHWVSTSGEALIMIFSAGTIESANWDHLTIYDGPDDQSPVIFDHVMLTNENLAGLTVIGTSGHIYMKNSSDGSVSCSSTTGSDWTWIWEVECLNCTGATASYNVITDCDNYQFSVDIHITSLGSDPSLDISADSLGTVLATATDTGMYTVGPFTANIPVHITLQNSDNNLCNVVSPALVNPLCPQILTCGDPAVETLYCYGLSDAHAWHWQADSPTDSLSLLFLAGSIQAVFSPTTGDHLRIYDGPDNTSPLLFDHMATVLFDLTDLLVTSSGPDIYMEMSSDNYGSCSSGATAEWDWLVGCADCSAPVATYTVVTDCDNFQYSVDVNVSAMGSNPVINITNTGGAPPVAATATGMYTVGPFTANQPVVVNLGDDANMLCSVHSPSLVNPLCPTPVNCGVDTLHETYCYTDYDNHIWHWMSTAAQPLFMQFSAGTIESSYYDHLTIYNGPDDQSPIMFDHVMTSQENLAGLQFIASSGHIYMKMTSDGSGSCSGGGQTQWAWDINCLDCTNPDADFSMTADCLHHSINVVVNVNDLGSGSFVRITNSVNTDTLTNVPLGITNVGPFPMDTAVTVTVINETNQYCQIVSPEFISSSTACIDSVCEIQLYDYCYANADTAWFMYQGTGPGPITIRFLSGQLLPNDRIQIYNGFNPAIAPLYQGNVGGNLAGFALNTTTAAHQLLLRVASDATGSCATGQATPMTWTVSCGAVGIEEQAQSDFSMYPNPTTGRLSIQLSAAVAHGSADLRIMDVSGRIVYQETFNANGGLNTFDLKSLQSGNYSVVISTKDWVKAQLLQIVH